VAIESEIGLFMVNMLALDEPAAFGLTSKMWAGRLF
jgi:hypothetical protein